MRSCFSMPPPWERLETDGNRGSCEVCGVAGDLVCCEECPSAYHIGCIPCSPDSEDAFEISQVNRWLCPSCVEFKEKRLGVTMPLARDGRAESQNVGMLSHHPYLILALHHGLDTIPGISCRVQQAIKRCVVCKNATDISHTLLCDLCEAEYHTYCVDPPLHCVPTEAWVSKQPLRLLKYYTVLLCLRFESTSGSQTEIKGGKG